MGEERGSVGAERVSKNLVLVKSMKWDRIIQ